MPPRPPTPLSCPPPPACELTCVRDGATRSAKTKATTPRSVYIKVLPADGTTVSDEEMARLGLVGVGSACPPRSSLPSADHCCVVASQEGARGAAALVDMPTNILHSDAYIAYVKSKIAELPEPTVELQVIQGTDLRDRGFGGLWRCVARCWPLVVTSTVVTVDARRFVSLYAVLDKRPSTCLRWRFSHTRRWVSEHVPVLACRRCRRDVSTHSQAGGGVEGVPTVAMCGKGIMYDTGGLSIKTKTGVRRCAWFTLTWCHCHTQPKQLQPNSTCTFSDAWHEARHGCVLPQCLAHPNTVSLSCVGACCHRWLRWPAPWLPCSRRSWPPAKNALLAVHW